MLQFAEGFHNLEAFQRVLSHYGFDVGGHEYVSGAHLLSTQDVLIKVCLFINLEGYAEVVLNEGKKLGRDFAGKEAIGVLEHVEEGGIPLEEQVEEVGLADFPLSRSVDLPQLFAEDAVAQSLDNFLFGAGPLQPLG